MVQKWTFDEPMVSPAPEKASFENSGGFYNFCISVMVSKTFLVPLNTNVHIGFECAFPVGMLSSNSYFYIP